MSEENPKVHVQMRFQVNLGDFNLITVEFGCDDHRRGDETTSEAYDRVFNLVNQKISEKIEQIKSEVKASKVK
jgi:hypothetical protein